MSERSSDAVDAIELLADETRIDILRELAAYERDRSADAALSFSDLRDRVGIPDSGRFNYHLDRLLGKFVRETDDGYELAYAGEAIIDAANHAIRDRDSSSDNTCPVCGEENCNRRIHVHLDPDPGF